MRGGRTGGKGRRGWAAVAEWVVLAVVAILIAFIVQRFFFQAFYIPSRSMEPTLSVGDRVLVNKLSYRLHDVRRGDLVVFEAPEGERTAEIEDFVKRVIALGGETIEWREEEGVHNVYIDGQLLDEPYLPPQAVGRTTIDGAPPGCAATTSTPHVSCTVPAGAVLVMGDNRTQSKDGRAFGPVAEDAIVGRVFINIWPPTVTWLYLAAAAAALFGAYLGIRAMIRSRREPGEPEPPPDVGPPEGAPTPPDRPQPAPHAATSSTIDWTRSE